MEKLSNQEKMYLDEYGSICREKTDRVDAFLSDIKKPWKKTFHDEINRITNIGWKKEKFTIWLLPKATPRPRSTNRGNFFYVKGSSDNKKLFMKYFRKWDMDMIRTPCKFTCVSYFPIPKSMKPLDQLLAEYGFIRPISKPDFDNIAKTYADMIQGSMIADDALIVEGTSMKYYSWKPRIEITVEYMESFDSEFNRQKILKRKD